MAAARSIDPAHVDEEVRRLVDPARHDDVLAALADIRKRGDDAVWQKLTALHLAGGRADRVRQWVTLANDDSRELIVAVRSRLPPTWDARFKWPTR